MYPLLNMNTHFCFGRSPVVLAKPRKRKMSQSSDDNEKKPKRPRKTSSKVNACGSCIVKISWVLFSPNLNKWILLIVHSTQKHFDVNATCVLNLKEYDGVNVSPCVNSQKLYTIGRNFRDDLFVRNMDVYSILLEF